MSPKKPRLSPTGKIKINIAGKDHEGWYELKGDGIIVHAGIGSGREITTQLGGSGQNDQQVQGLAQSLLRELVSRL